MAKLNQIIAVVNGKKTRTKETLTGVYKTVQKTPLFDGLSRSYTPSNEDGETIPAENKLPQAKAGDVVATAVEALTSLFDVTFMQEVANREACADIKVADTVVASQVPVTYMLFLEKQLVDIATLIGAMPTLDPAESWHYDSNRGYYVTDPVKSNRTKKVMKNHVKAEATDKHPAQVEVYTEDIKVGEWSTIKMSGAIPMDDKKQLLVRVRALQDAVKMAREEANNTEVADVEIAKNILTYIFNI